MTEIADEKNGYNLNISRYVSTSESEQEIDLAGVHNLLVDITTRARDATARHNEFLAGLGLPPLPM